MAHTDLINNTAGTDGGGIHARTPSITLTSTRFVGNAAVAGSGGDTYFFGSVMVPVA